MFKKNIIAIFTASLILVAILGWAQYFLFADLTYLKHLGWDDHLGRLVGTFLDPAFTGMIISAGFFTVFVKYIYTKKLSYLLLSLFFLVSLLFTYSRASFVALMVGLAVVYYLKRKILPIVFILIIFILGLPFLPRTEGEGVRLERTKSVNLRIQNYHETIEIAKTTPLFGVGFNNICWHRAVMYSDHTDSHSCSGSDSSILLILATAGIVGLLIFLNLLNKTVNNISTNYYGTLSKVLLAATFFHSFFSNSIFYSWIMGAGALLLAVSSKE